MKKPLAKCLNLGFLLLGLALLAGVLARMDGTEVLRQLMRIGPLFALSLACYVAAVLGSSAAWWSMCDPAVSRARFHHFVSALWAGHALNTVTPGASLGEVFKGSMMRGRVEAEEVVASLVSYYYLGTFISQLFTLIGPLACLVLLDLPPAVIWTLLAIALAFFLPVTAIFVFLRLGAADKLVRLATRLPLIRIRDPEAWLAKARLIDNRIQRFPAQRPKRFALALLFLIWVRLMQVAEIWVLLFALMPDQNAGWLLLLSFVTQSASQLISWLMTFVPSQVGVAESGSALLFQMLHLDPLLGLSMELARRVRKLLGTALGLSIAWWSMRRREAAEPEIDRTTHPVPP